MKIIKNKVLIDLTQSVIIWYSKMSQITKCWTFFNNRKEK